MKIRMLTILAVVFGVSNQGYADQQDPFVENVGQDLSIASTQCQQSLVYEEQEEAFACAYKAHNTQRGDWITRVRALYVLPMDSSGSVNTIPHSGVGVNPSWSGEIDFGYMFTRNLGAMLILGTSHNTLIGEKALSGTKIGTTWLLPPVLTLQWRFFPSSLVQPYVGAGVNWTLFYAEHCSLPHTHIELSNSWGPALQMGTDLFFYKDWMFNIDVKYVWIDTDATLKGSVKGKVHVDINPWLIAFGFGRKW